MLICSCCSELFNHGSPSSYLVMQNEQDAWDRFTAAYGGKRLVYFEGYEDIWTLSTRPYKDPLMEDCYSE
jgi:hypothetical protein